MAIAESPEPKPVPAGPAQADWCVEGKRVPHHAHVVYLWETDREFADAVRFLEAGLRGSDHCVILGHGQANRTACKILQERGFDVPGLLSERRLTILGGNPSGGRMLETITAAFRQATAGGAPLIRLLVNVGWGKNDWPDDPDMLAFEAKLTAAAGEFPCVVVCMYEVPALSGLIVRHGAFGTHPFFVREGSVHENPHHVATDLFLEHLEAIASVMIRDVTDRSRAEETLRVVTEGTAGVAGSDFFRSLVRHLAQALEVRYAFVAECTDVAKTRVRTLAFWTGEGFGEEVAFQLRGTPCEKVVGGDICCYPERLQSLFPEDEGLVTLGAESYLGVPVYGSSRNILGHLVAMDDRPMNTPDRGMPILRIFASRAGVELERTHVEEALRRSEGRLRALLEINNAIITKLARDELFDAVCQALGRVIPFDRVALSLYEPESDVLRLVTYAGPYRSDYSPIGRALDLRDSPAGWAFLHQKPVLRRDLETERQSSSEERAYGHGFRSLCALPLVVRGASIGTITVGSRTRFQYAEADAEFLKDVANQIAIAIDNMKSYEEVVALKARVEAENVYLQEEIKTEYNFEEIVGQSPPLKQLLRKLERVAPTDANVLVQGETGTGKELVARAVHNLSRRKDRPLVKVNCGAIPAGLVESELFGHEKGAFTGATQRRIGRFELADGGTIFLDEVTELPLDTQVKLLRVLQEGEFERVGSSQTHKVDVRVIAAANRDFKEVITNGSFRSDLFYRLSVFPLEVPPLRERKSDVPLLVNYFLSKFAKKLGKDIEGVSQAAMESLMHYSWPGNVRELQNVIERGVVLAQGPIVHVDESIMRGDAGNETPSLDTLERVERVHILRALAETNWVIHGKKGAAAILGINPSTLRSRMEKLDIKKPEGSLWTAKR